MFLIPTQICGIATGLVAIFRPNRWTLTIFALSSLAHAAIGLGCHPT